MPRPPRIGDWISLLALTLFWGTAFLFTELALQAFPPATLVAGRISIAALVLLAFMRFSGLSLPPLGRGWVPVLLMAIFSNVLPFHLIAWAQQHIDSSLAGVLMAAMPLFMLTMAHFFIPGATLTRYRVAGCAAGFAGVVLVIGPEVLAGLTNNTALWGAAAVLGAVFSYSASSIYARRIDATNPLRMAVGMLLVASLLSLPVAAFDMPKLEFPSATALASLAVLGLLSTGLSTVLYFRIVQGPGPTFLSFISYLVPACAVLSGALFLNESLSISAYAGLALILSGVALSEIGPRLGRAVQTHRARRVAWATARAD